MDTCILKGVVHCVNLPYVCVHMIFTGLRTKLTKLTICQKCGLDRCVIFYFACFDISVAFPDDIVRNVWLYLHLGYVLDYCIGFVQYIVVLCLAKFNNY